MPNLPNAEKTLRQDVKRQANNRRYKNRIKKISRLIEDSLKIGNKKEAENLLPTYFKAIDKAAKKNILHKNTANRRKAIFSKKINTDKVTPTTEVKKNKVQPEELKQE